MDARSHVLLYSLGLIGLKFIHGVSLGVFFQ